MAVVVRLVANAKCVLGEKFGELKQTEYLVLKKFSLQN